MNNTRRGPRKNPRTPRTNPSEGTLPIRQRPRQLTWNDLFTAGSIVMLRASCWPARVKIRPSDLGIEDSIEVQKALMLGTHRLLPSEAFLAITDTQRRAKHEIEKASLPFPLIYGARYVPTENVKALQDRLDVIGGEFRAAVNVFIETYDARQAEMLPILTKALQDAARTTAAADAAVQRLMLEYPPASVVLTRFRLAWNTYAIQGPRNNAIGTALGDEAVDVREMVGKMVASLREEVTSKLADVIQLIAKGGKLQQRSIDSALLVLERVESLNVLGDEILANQVVSLRRSLRSINLEENVADTVIAGLGDVKKDLEASIEDAVAAAEAKLTGLGRRKFAKAA